MVRHPLEHDDSEETRQSVARRLRVTPEADSVGVPHVKLTVSDTTPGAVLTLVWGTKTGISPRVGSGGEDRR
jgi:hypothetical protein